MDVHYPPLQKFGRYPYWNGFLGRSNTVEEEEWIKESGLFKGPPSDIKDKIRADVQAGQWTPLVGE